MPSSDTQFPEGTSGNPGGRPKGSKNKITLQKMMLEEALRDASKEKMPEILNKAMEMALLGDRTMIKLLLELHMSRGIAEDRHAAAEKVDIKIITSSPPPAEKPSAAEAVLTQLEEAK